MRNRIFYLFVGLLFLVHSSYGQNNYSFTFEDEVPSQWTTQNGTFSLSDEHFMEGSKSLCWETTVDSESVFTVGFQVFSSGSYSCFFNIYSAELTENVLVVDFLDDGGVVKKTANVSMDFKGWRDFNRAYAKDFKSLLTVNIASVKFTLKNSTGQIQRIFFDNANFRATTDASRQVTDLMVLDTDYIEQARRQLLTVYANFPDIESSTPTVEELAGLEKLKNVYKRIPAAADVAELRIVRNYIRALNITRNSDGSVKGDIMPSSASDLTSAFMIDITRKLEAIAFSAQTSESDKVLFNDFVDYIIDQGFVYKFPRITYSDYNTVRTLPAQLMNILPLCADEQRVEILKMVAWIIEYGFVYMDQASLTPYLNSDYFYLYIPYLYAYAIYQVDEKDAVRELKALTRFMGRSMEYTTGNNEILKVDGTGFHHNTHYNAYMYVFNTWIDNIYNLKGTVFRLPEDAYERLKKAVITMHIMSTKATSTTSMYYANSLSGRSPLSSGRKVTIITASFERLIEIGGDIKGSDIDTELASAYDYFYMTNKYNAPQANYDGYYQFNYSGMGLYRYGNWVVTMRAPTTRLWGSEIYGNSNRFGRYQSHGTLEILYDGDQTASGLPNANEGWDWNVVPGTTTVHYTSWTEMMPSGNLLQRFDQFTKTKNFAGALAWDRFGMFASDFDQGDTWSGQNFIPTNLEFKKSVYAFGQMLISMGSNIKSSGSYSDDMITATNLFQSVKTNGATDKEFNVNGTVMSAGSPDITNESVDNFWIITPENTGYYIPKGNDKVIIKYGEQEGPNHTGSDVNSPAKSIAAKAYINHGVKISDKQHLFVVVPGTTQEQMQNLATKIGDDGGEIFSILSRTEKLHALKYLPENIYAYSFFESVDNLDFGLVKGSTTNLLLMQKNVDTENISFAVSCPNLNPVLSSSSKWQSIPTETTITVKGAWYLNEVSDNAMVEESSGDETKINITLTDGLAVYFDLSSTPGLSISQEQTEEWVDISFDKLSEELVFRFAKANNEKVKIDIFSIDGINVGSAIKNDNNSNEMRLKLQNSLGSVVKIVRVASGDKVKTLKIVSPNHI